VTGGNVGQALLEAEEALAAEAEGASAEAGAGGAATEELQKGAGAGESPRGDDGAFDAAPLLDGSDAELTAEEREMVWQKTQVRDAAR
jgi:hypothetical protein